MEYLVLDVGGSSIKYSIMTEKVEFIEKGNIPTPLDNIENFIDTVGTIYDKYKDRIEGIAISMPGIIDSENGYAYTGGSLVYNENKEIVKLLKMRCKTKIVIQNDGKCAALAEVWQGSLKYCNDGIVIVLGTGVGGGIIKDRKIHMGRHFSAGEFSFIVTNAENANETDSLWAFKSGSKALLELIAKVKNLNSNEIDGYKVFEYINNGDKEALKILDKFTYNIAIQIFNLQCAFDPEKIVIGGGISAQDILIDYIKMNLDKFYDNLPFNIPRAEVVKCEFCNDSNLIGALYNFFTFQS